MSARYSTDYYIMDCFYSDIFKVSALFKFQSIAICTKFIITYKLIIFYSNTQCFSLKNWHSPLTNNYKSEDGCVFNSYNHLNMDVNDLT